MDSPAPGPIDHIDRWRRIVVARREQHDAVVSAQGRTTDDYWARRAESFHKFVQEIAAAGDPFLDCVLRHLQPEDTVLDVGAGTGRHAIPLARHARQVTALDPSPAMLRFLREDVAAQGLTNVEVVEDGWPEAAAQVPPARRPPSEDQALAEALTPPAALTGYHARPTGEAPSPVGNLWNLLPPDGAIVIGDIGAVVAQFGHTCA